MNMDAQLVGLGMITLGSVFLAWLVFWKHFQGTFWFACALIAVSIGYLATTFAPQDLAIWVFGNQPWLAVTAPEGAMMVMFVTRAAETVHG